MKKEEILEHLLGLQRAEDQQLVVEDEEIAECLDASEQLCRLQEVVVPNDLTARLEHSFRARIRSSILDQQNGRIFLEKTDISSAPHSRPAHARRTPQRRTWAAVLGIAAVLVLAFTSLLAFSAHSQSGHPLVDSKQTEFRATPTNILQHSVSTNIAHLQRALGDLRTAVADRRGDRAIQLVLKTVADKTDACRSAFAALPPGSQRTTAQQDLQNVLFQEDQTIRQLLSQVDWPMRLLFTRQLGALGDPVPTVTHVTVHSQSNGTLLITLTGTHFASQAKFLLNGQVKGIVTQVTSGQLVASIQTSQWGPDSHAFGVLNPDDTAAQLVFQWDDDDD